MKYVEYKECQVPNDILDKLEQSALDANQGLRKKPMTFGEAGVFDWLNDLSKKEGWRVVWQISNFPYIILEREQEK
jgi:hypothetical protein